MLKNNMLNSDYVKNLDGTFELPEHNKSEYTYKLIVDAFNNIKAIFRTSTFLNCVIYIPQNQNQEPRPVNINDIQNTMNQVYVIKCNNINYNFCDLAPLIIFHLTEHSITEF